MIFLFRLFRKFLVKIGIIIDGKYYWKKEVIKGIDYIINNNKFNIILASYPTPVNLEIGEIIHNRYNIPLVVDYRDGIMFDPFIEIINSSIIFRKRMIFLERRISKISSLIITVNQDMNDYYKKSYSMVKSIVISNGFDDEEYNESSPISLPNGTNVVYTGGIGRSRKIYPFNFLSSFLGEIFRTNPNINFIFIGDYENNEKKMFSLYNNVYVYPKVDNKIIIKTQRIADCLLLISGPNGSTSGKMYEYLFSQRPILNIGGQNGVAHIINGINFGFTYEPNNIRLINYFLKQLSYGKLEINFPYIELYTRRYQCQLLSKELQRILE